MVLFNPQYKPVHSYYLKLDFLFFVLSQIPESQKKSGSNHAVSALKFRILTNFIKLGYAVLLSDVDIVTLQDPFKHLVRDSDVESLSDGWDADTAYGYNDVKEDASMGWARYAHSMRIFVFNSGLFYLRPTQAALDLLDKVVYRVESENGWDQALFNECIFFPNSPRNKVRKEVLPPRLTRPNSGSLIVPVDHNACIARNMSLLRNVHLLLSFAMVSNAK